MSQSPKELDVSDIGRWPKFMLSSPFVETVNRIRAGGLKAGHSDWVQATQQADTNMQRARAYIIRNDMERALVNYAAAAMTFRRAKLHSPAGHSQLTTEEQSSIVAKLQESCRYIRLFAESLINGNTRYHDVSESTKSSTRRAWRQLQDLTGYDDGAEEDETKSSSSLIQMHSDTDARSITGQQDLPTSSRALSPSLLPPHVRVPVPENPPSPLSYWIELRPIDSYPHSVPEVTPEPISLSVDLHLLDSEDQISEQTSEPRSPLIGLHHIDNDEHGIPEVAPEPTSLYLDLHPLDDDADSIPDDLPKPQSYWIDLHDINEHKLLVPDISPDPPSLFLDLHPLEDTNSIPEISPSGLEVSLEEKIQ